MKGIRKPSRQPELPEDKFLALQQFLDCIRFQSVFDVGCGRAGMDVLIARQYGVREFHLLDGNGSGAQLSGYAHFVPKPWGDVIDGKTFLEAHVPDAEVYTYHPHDQFEFDVDLVISLRSWGLHYPVTTYLEVVKRCLRPGGHLVLDLRHGKEGLTKLLSSGFEFVQEIPETSTKCSRIALRKE